MAEKNLDAVVVNSPESLGGDYTDGKILIRSGGRVKSMQSKTFPDKLALAREIICVAGELYRSRDTNPPGPDVVREEIKKGQPDGR